MCIFGADTWLRKDESYMCSTMKTLLTSFLGMSNVFASFHLSGNTKYVELLAFLHGTLFFVMYEKGSLISYCVDVNWGHPQRFTAGS